MPSANFSPGDPSSQPNGVTRWLAQCRDEDREVAKRAREEVYSYLEGQLLGVALRRAGMDPDNGLSARDLFHDVVLGMLDAGMPYENTEHLRRAFCTTLYRKAIDHLRRRARRLAALSREPAGREADRVPGRRLETADNLEVLDRAVAELEETRPQLADALKARVLVNPEVRFDQTGHAFSRLCGDQAVDQERPFREMGDLLGCPLGQAYERYRAATRWLRRRLPGMTPDDFTGAGE